MERASGLHYLKMKKLPQWSEEGGVTIVTEDGIVIQRSRSVNTAYWKYCHMQYWSTVIHINKHSHFIALM